MLADNSAQVSAPARASSPPKSHTSKTPPGVGRVSAIAPVEIKMPVPIMSPAINITAENNPICRLSSVCAIAFTISREKGKQANCFYRSRMRSYTLEVYHGPNSDRQENHYETFSPSHSTDAF